jgi:hypothetical protein
VIDAQFIDHVSSPVSKDSRVRIGEGIASSLRSSQ